MPIDLRWLIGRLFVALGLVLVAYGVMSGLDVAAGRLNAGWGALMTVFGAVLGWFGQRHDVSELT